MEKRTFWSDEAHIHVHKNKGKMRDGYYFRSFDLNKFMERVEKGEHIGIINENGQAAVMMPVDDETLRIYTENNNEGS